MMKVLTLLTVVLSTVHNMRALESEELRPSSVSECLVKKTMYHRQSGQCQTPLEQGPCHAGQILVPDSEPGFLKCYSLFIPNFCTAIILQDGSVGCEEDSEQSLYSRGQCGAGEFLLPDNFREDTLPCPRGFSCRPSRDSLQYNSALKSFKKGKVNVDQRQYLKELVCDYQSKSLCLPDDNGDSLFTEENLLASLMTAPARCQVNPCQAGRRPWLAEDGHYRCLQEAGDSSHPLHCPTHLQYDQDGIISCRLLALKSVAPLRRGRCRRRQIWSKYRNTCVTIFG